MFNKVKWKRIKDMFTLGKNWAEVFKSIIIWYKSTIREQEIYEEMNKYDNQVVGVDQHSTLLTV